MNISPDRHSRRHTTARVVLAGLLVSAAIVAVASYFLPSRFKLNRGIDISAPPSYLYEEINDLERWPVWSYWFAEGTQVRYGETTKGIRATCSWKGKRREGVVTITGHSSDEMVIVQLDFPGSGSAICEFRLATDSLNKSTTRLTMFVTVSGDENDAWTRWKRFIFATRFGAAFDHNLSRLKQIAESKPVFSLGITEELLAPAYYIQTRALLKSGRARSEGIAEALRTFAEILQPAGVPPDGNPFCIFPADSAAQVLCGLPVAPDVNLPGTYQISQFYSGDAIRGVDSSGYSDILATHKEIQRYIRYKGYIPNGDPWEVYMTDPVHNEPSHWVTHVYYPVRR